jgi:hypothetical protein
MVISYLHDIWLKIKVLKCYMESTYNVTCMLCKLCLPCLIFFGTMPIPFGTYFKLLHEIPKGTSTCMMTILWRLVTMHMKLVHVQSSNVNIGEENNKYSKVDSCCSTIDWFRLFFWGNIITSPTWQAIGTPKSSSLAKC